MKVRNHTLKNTEYKGRWTEARDEECPCRPCFSSHDCGFRTGGGKWVISVECLTRYNSGCPDPIPEPQHIFKKKNTCVRCLSCVRVEVKKEEKKTDDITFESVAEWKRREEEENKK